MSSTFDVLKDIFSEILQKNGLEAPKTTAALAEVIGVSAAQLSRIKNGRSSFGYEVMRKVNKKIDELEKDEELRKIWKTKLKEAQSESSKTPSKTLITDTSAATESLEAFDKFFQTSEDEKRIVCCSYRDIPQSTAKGRYPEYIEKSAAQIRKGLACASFQFFGPLDQIEAKLKTALKNKDTESFNAWSYIYRLASGVYEGFNKTREAVLKDSNNKGQAILYEASTVPSLINCNAHSRLFYSEKCSGANRIRIVQLVLGQDKEHFIECSSEPAFQSVVAEQFYPILDYWRDNKGRLPVENGEIEKFCSDKEESSWRIP
jgi:transcriptional regulator with XRE-family HTH domain